MKVLLVDVPFGPMEVGGSTGNFSLVRNVIPALGLAYLAAVAEEAGHEVAILDCARGLPKSAIVEKTSSFSPKVVGVTATTPTYVNAVKTAQMVKEIDPAIVTVLGGPHPTEMPEQSLRGGPFDYLVIGEGEETWVELLGKIDSGGAPSEVAGLAFIEDGKCQLTAAREKIKELDKIPFPARHLLPPIADYSPTPASYRALPLVHIMTTRGCPSKCTFCDRGIFGSSYRARSAENVLAEVEEVVERYGAREIRFFDDTFTIDKKRLTAICEGLAKKHPNLLWTCLTKVDKVDKEILQMMKEAGCWQILYGLESGDDNILQSLKKGTTVEQGRQAVNWAYEAGLRVRADFIVGTPLETLETLQKTLDFALSLPIDFAHFNKFVPFPGTEIYERLIEQGFQFDVESPSSTLDHDALVYVPAGLKEEAYRQFLDKAYKAFYLRPGFLLWRLFSMRTWTEFTGHLKGFFSIASM